MDYKERYEQALKRAKAAIDVAADKDLVKGVATTIFPELRESEDERIRKYFIWIVKNVLDNIQGLKLSKEQTRELIDNFDGIKVSDMLAYLEKQKEEPYPKDIGCWDEKSYNAGIIHVLRNLDIYGLQHLKGWDKWDVRMMNTGVLLCDFLKKSLPRGDRFRSECRDFEIWLRCLIADSETERNAER